MIALVEAADLVEAHWSEMAFALRTATPSTRTMLFAHDIPLQREVRWLIAAWRQRAPKKVLWRAWRTAAAAATHRRSSDAADILVTLSPKDAHISGRSRGRSPAEWIDPPLWDSGPEPPHRDAPEEPTAVFVAAFNRRENVEAATWLMHDVWPRVAAAVPEARLVLAGAHPPDALRAAAERRPDIVVTGYVDDLEALYGRVTVAVVPLHSGAGVKFKTIDALVRDLPVVSTRIGAEGVLDAHGRHPFIVTDEPGAFADAVIDVLLGRTASDARVGSEARERYGTDAYARRLSELISIVTSAR
ncbi:glycosyltransferase [Agromyces sp. CCNWLW208]